MLESIIEAFPEEGFYALSGLDGAIIGVDEREMRLIYSVSNIIEILSQNGMSEDEAYEYYEFNIFGLHLGDKTPILCDDTFEIDNSHLNN